MARRRVNKKFLVALFVLVAGGTVAILIAQNLLIKDHADRWITMGNQAMEDAKWADAATDFARAGQLDPNNPDIQMRLAGALQKVAQLDPEKIGAVRAAYERALEINPRYMPALRNLIDMYQAFVLMRPSAETYNQLIVYAKRGHDIDPADKQMAMVADLLVAQKWLKRFETSDKDIDDAMKHMQDELKTDPSNATLMATVAQVWVFGGQLLGRQRGSADQPKAATDKYDNARKLFTDALDPKIGGQDKNAAIHYRYGQILMYLSGCDMSRDGNPKKDQDAAWEQVGIAQSLTTDKDFNFLTINNYAAELAEQRSDYDQALKIRRTIREKMPRSIQTELDLAKLLGRSRRRTEAEPRQAQIDRAEGEGIVKDLMNSLKDKENNQLAGVRVTLLEALTEMQVNDYSDPLVDAQTKRNLRETIQSSLAKLDDAMGSGFSLDIERTGARFQFVSHDWPATIQTLNAMITANSQAAQDYNCLFMLGQAYENSHQTGEALTTYGRMIQLFPQEIVPRFFHARLQETNNPTQAQTEIDELANMDPGDPRILLLKMGTVVTDPDHPSDEAIASFKAYPETTGPDISIKARAAMVVHQYDDAVRLFNTLIAANDPRSDDDYVMLAQVYFKMGNRQAAMDTANRGLKVNPKNANLSLLISALNNEAPSARVAIRQEAATQVTDPVAREMRLAQLAGEQNDPAGQESHLKAAEAAASDDAKSAIWDAMFTFYVSANRLPDASALIPKLAAANADSAGGRMYELKVAQAKGDFAHAMDLANSLAKDRPDFASTYIAFGDILLGQNHVDQAMAQYEVALQKQANSFEAYQGLVRCAYEQGKLPDALRYIQEGLRKIPGSPGLRDMLISHHLNYGDPADAISVLSEEIRNDPNSAKLQSAMIDVLLRVAASRKGSDPQTAAQALQEALKRSSDGISRWPDDDAFYISQSDTYQRLNQPQDAEKTLLTFAARDQWKDSPYPLARLSQFYEDNKQPDKAEAELRTALDLSKNRLDVEMDYGRLLVKHKKYDDCLTMLSSTNRDTPEIRDMRIRVLWGAGRADQAEAEFNSDIKGNPPDEVELRSAWGRLLMDGGKFAAALEQANKVLAIRPNNVEAYFTRGYCRLRVQPPDVENAVQDLVKYVQAPNAFSRTRARMELAQVYIGTNRSDEAEAQLSMAMRSDPSNIAVRMKMVELLSNSDQPRYMQAISMLRQVDTLEPYKSDADVFRNEAILYHDLKDLNNALVCGQKALALRPDDQQAGDIFLGILLEAHRYQDVMNWTATMPDAIRNAWWALSKRAQAEKELGNPAAAQADAQRAIAAAMALHDSSSVYAAAQAISQSLGFDQAIALLAPPAKDDLTCQLTLATFYQSAGNDQQAVSTADLAMARLPQLNHDDQIRVVSTAAQIYQGAKPQPIVDKAYAAYQQWVKLEPNNVAALNNLAWMLMEDYSPPRVADATQYMNRAAGLLSPSSGMRLSVQDTEGWLQILSGSAASGVDILNKVSQARPNPETYLHVAQGYLQMQFPQAAGDHAKLGLNMIKKQDPKDQDAALAAKLQDLINQCAQLQKPNQPAKAQ